MTETVWPEKPTTVTIRLFIESLPNSTLAFFSEGLHCVFVATRAFSSCSEWGSSLVVLHGLLIAVAFLIVVHGL